MDYQNILIEKTDNEITIWFNRPEVHNALNPEMIDELIHFFSNKHYNNARWIIMRGKGKSFCAGVDIKWMHSEMVEHFDSKFKLGELLLLILNCELPVISIVHGNVFAGAIGLIAASDIVLADKDTVFSLSEVKIGIIPAVISWFLIRKVGLSTATEWMLSGRKFSEEEACRSGLIHQFVIKDTENELNSYFRELYKCAPNAMRHVKKLLAGYSSNNPVNEFLNDSQKMLSIIRNTTEGKEGMNAFFEKRNPTWVI